MFDSASRFSLVETATQSPGVDFITRSPNGPFVDTGLTVNKFDSMFAESNAARLYLSLSTLREMAEGAGLFDPLRAENLEAESKGYQLGYADSMKENIGGTLGDLAQRLDDISGRLSGPHREGAVEEARPRDEREPLVLVVDGEDAEPRSERAHESAAPTGRTARQGNGSRRVKRPAGISAGTSDGNPFRI